MTVKHRTGQEYLVLVQSVKYIYVLSLKQQTLASMTALVLVRSQEILFYYVGRDVKIEEKQVG